MPFGLDLKSLILGLLLGWFLMPAVLGMASSKLGKPKLAAA